MTALSTQKNIKFALASDDGYIMPVMPRPYGGLEIHAVPASCMDSLYITSCLGEAEQALYNCSSRAVTLFMPNGDELKGQAILDKFSVKKVIVETSFYFG